MALGASRRRIQGMILGQALAVAAVGAGLGAAGAVMASGWLRHQIPGVGALHVWLVAAAAAVLMAMAAVAAYRPARQAMRLDPLEALRRE
jgi:ABC-type antimicrobial peptide transport system permease subunit